MDADGSNVRQLTDYPLEDQSPAWSPDGRSILFTTFRQRNFGVYIMDSDGLNQRPLIFQGQARNIDAVWSPDGTQVAFASDRSARNFDIYILTVATGDVRRVTTTPGLNRNPAWSRDGRALWYEAWEHGQPEIYRIALDDPTATPFRVTDDRARDSDPA
jgi:TolB protein